MFLLLGTNSVFSSDTQAAYKTLFNRADVMLRGRLNKEEFSTIVQDVQAEMCRELLSTEDLERAFESGLRFEAAHASSADSAAVAAATLGALPSTPADNAGEVTLVEAPIEREATIPVIGPKAFVSVAQSLKLLAQPYEFGEWYGFFNRYQKMCGHVFMV